MYRTGKGVSDARYQIVNTYAFTHRYGLEGHGFWIGDIVIGDGSEQLFFVFAIERRLTGEHLEQKDTIGPPIDTLAIFLIENDLGERSFNGNHGSAWNGTSQTSGAM